MEPFTKEELDVIMTPITDDIDDKICDLRQSDGFQHDVLGKYEEDGLEQGLDDDQSFEQAIDRIAEELTKDFTKYDHYLE